LKPLRQKGNERRLETLCYKRNLSGIAEVFSSQSRLSALGFFLLFTIFIVGIAENAVKKIGFFPLFTTLIVGKRGKKKTVGLWKISDKKRNDGDNINRIKKAVCFEIKA
jgi:hypothetical protein